MRLPLCFSSLGCPELSAEALCLLAKRQGVPTVEIRSLEGIVDYPGYLAANEVALERVAATFLIQGVRVALLGASFSLSRHTETDIDSLLAVCRVADRLAVPYVRIFGGGNEGKKMSPAEVLSAALLFRKAHDRWAASGLRCQLLVETHGSLVDSDTIGRFCELAERKVLFLWDTHHTWKLGGESLEKTFSLIGKNVRHIHCKDSVPRPSGSAFYQYVLPGLGGFPFDSLFRITNSLDHNVALSLEWERQWHPELEPLDQALAHFTRLAARARDVSDQAVASVS